MRRFACLVAIAIACAARPAHADGEALAQAKALFEEGVRLYESHETRAALERFTRSRDVFASSQNTMNVAICLDDLGRFDEALALYDELVAGFHVELAAPEKAAIARAIAALRAKVGTIEIASNVTGAITVDGRSRGTLPLLGPLRVLPGAHALRIAKDGYGTYEHRVEVTAGETTRVDARLEPLEASGELRVEEDGTWGSAVIVDGKEVGKTPWEGVLAPGKHVLWTRNGALGTAPAKVTILQGQAALVRVHPRVLGAAARVVVEPRSAAIVLDGVLVARGAWEGRLPVGSYELELEASGYRGKRVRLDVRGASSRTPLTEYKLDVDPESPSWPKKSKEDERRVFVGAVLSFPIVVATNLSGCAHPCGVNANYARGLVAVRAGVRFGAVAVELEPGWITLGLEPSARYHAIYVAAGVGFRMPVGGGLGIVPRVGFGVTWNRDVEVNQVSTFFRLEVGPELQLGENARISGAFGLVTVERATFFAPSLGASFSF